MFSALFSLVVGKAQNLFGKTHIVVGKQCLARPNKLLALPILFSTSSTLFLARLISFLVMSFSSQNTDVKIICVRAKNFWGLAKNFWGLVLVVVVVVVVVVFVVGGL